MEAVRIRDRMSDTFQAMQASQGKLQGSIDQQLGKLKTLTEKTAIIHTQLNKVPKEKVQNSRSLVRRS